MNTASYDRVLQQQIEEMHHLFLLPGRRVFTMLKKLEKEALAREDDSLAGFVYFYFANAHISRNESEKGHKYIRLAVRHLMRSGDDELLARTFNLFALEAQYNGCYDIAQNYYYMAYSLVQDDPKSLVRAILDNNIGSLMAETGDYKAAIRRIRRALPIVRFHSDDIMSDQNLAVGHLNISLNSLRAGRTEEAKKDLRIAEKILLGGGIEETIQLTLLLLRAHLAFSTGSYDDVLPPVNEIADRIRNGTLYNDFIYDLYGFCRLLLKNGGEEYASILIDAIEQSDRSDASKYRRLLLAELAADLYTLQNNSRMLIANFERQYEISRQQSDAQRRMYLHSVELMMQISELREEQERYRRENEYLKLQAETDPLTRLPNRYAMNRELEKAHAKMLKAGLSFGIGIVDIDAFKQYNDLYGHAQGDQCLTLVADALRKVADANGLFVARYGGDEFVLIYEDRTDGEISRIASDIRRQMPVRVSHGFINVVPEEDSKLFDLLSRADAEMYREKKGVR